MKNQEKWSLLSKKQEGMIKHKKFKQVEFPEENVLKFVDKSSNLTYYLTEENNHRYIRCFYDYQEINFETFLKEMNIEHVKEETIFNDKDE